VSSLLDLLVSFFRVMNVQKYLYVVVCTWCVLCVIVSQVPSPEVVDRYGKQELLFLGPDEGSSLSVVRVVLC